jgi:hypothetical protein
LPDGIFANQKSHFWYILEGAGIGLFYGHFVDFTAIWYLFWPFWFIFEAFVIFYHFGILYQEKSGNPDDEDKTQKAAIRTKSSLVAG